MTRTIRLGEFLLGVEGLALLRGLLTGTDADAAARLEEAARIATGMSEPPYGLALDAAEEDVRTGYAQWSASYDGLANPLIASEEPVVHGLLEGLALGRALDAACGTGRHTARLVALGHEVTGVDASLEMLALALEKVPAARFLLGDLTALPLPSASMDVAVCSLALGHLPDLGPPVAELARVLRPGGRVIASVFHPLGVVLGGQALYPRPDGHLGFVREHLHLTGDWVAAFDGAGLTIRGCHEPLADESHVAMMQFAASIPEAARAAYVGTPMALVWDLERR